MRGEEQESPKMSRVQKVLCSYPVFELLRAIGAQGGFGRLCEGGRCPRERYETGS